MAEIICPDCDGVGEVEIDEGDWDTCFWCAGCGMVDEAEGEEEDLIG